jgi:hypothetical protein
MTLAALVALALSSEHSIMAPVSLAISLHVLTKSVAGHISFGPHAT